MAHSIIAPSSAGIWGPKEGCRGWPLMNQLFPDTEDSVESAEGTASHGVGESLIGFGARGLTPKAEEYVGGQAANGVVIDQDMYDGALVYANDVRSVMCSAAVFTPAIEQTVCASRIHDEAWGTPDCWLYDEKNRTLYLWDYKYGHLLVEAFENWQLLVYLCAILEHLDIDGLEDQYVRVEFRIVQPRAFHPKGQVRSWSFMACDARAYFNQLQASALESLSPGAETRSGAHCRNCNARHGCEAALTAGMGLYEVAAKPVPMNLDALALGVQQNIVTRAIKQLEYLKTGYDAEIEARVRRGEGVPYWRTEQGVGRETWSRPSEEVIRMGQMFGQDLRQKNPVTPKQAVSLGIDAAVIKGYSHKPQTGVKIVPDNGNHAKEVFSK